MQGGVLRGHPCLRYARIERHWRRAATTYARRSDTAREADGGTRRGRGREADGRRRDTVVDAAARASRRCNAGSGRGREERMGSKREMGWGRGERRMIQIR